MKAFGIGVVVFVTLTVLDYCLYAFNHPWFPGEYALGLAGAIAAVFIGTKLIVKIFLYQPKK